jgi:hypothetical protein
MERNKVIEFAQNILEDNYSIGNDVIIGAGMGSIINSAGQVAYNLKNKRKINKGLTKAAGKGAIYGGVISGAVSAGVRSGKYISKSIDKAADKYDDNYSVGAGSPGGGAIGSMGGNTNKGLHKLDQDHHIKALKFAKDKMLSKDNNYASIALSDRLSRGNERLKIHMKKGIAKKDLSKESFTKPKNIKDKINPKKVIKGLKHDRELRLKLRAKAKTGKANQKELELLRKGNDNKMIRRGMNSGIAATGGVTAKTGLAAKAAGMGMSSLENLVGATAITGTAGTVGAVGVGSEIGKTSNTKKKRALALGNREREKQLITDDLKKNKALRKLKVHLKSNKSARKLGHYK